MVMVVVENSRNKSNDEYMKAEIVETTFRYPKLLRILVVSCLFYFHFLNSFLVFSENECLFLELTFVSGAD